MKSIASLIKILRVPFGRRSRRSYLRSLRGADASKEAILELLGCPSTTVEAIASAVLSGQARYIANQPRSVLWDITPVWLAAREGRCADAEALWFLELGLALSHVIPLEFGIYDLFDGTMKTLAEDGVATIRGTTDTLESDPSLSRPEVNGDPAPTANIIVSVPHGDLSADRIGCILRPRLRTGSLLIAVIRNFDVWNSPEWFTEARRDATRAMHQLYYRCASRVLTEPHFSYINAESVIEAFGPKGGATVSRVPLSVAAASPPIRGGGDRKRSLLLALRPHDPRELASIIGASRTAPQTRLVLIGTDARSEPDEGTADFAAIGEGPEIEEVAPEPAAVRGAMQCAVSLLVPRSRSDAELWIGEAARHAVRVFVSSDAVISEYWREMISGYVDSSKADSLARGWLGPQRSERPAGISPEATAAAALEQIAARIRDLVRVPAVVRAPRFAHQGVFYCLIPSDGRERPFGNGLDFREGSGWADPTDDGSGISGREAILRFRLWSVFKGTHRCMVLVSSSREFRGVVTVKLGSDGESVAASEVRVSPSELKWIRLEFDPGSGVRHDVRLAIGCQADDGLAQSSDSVRAIGWFIHPLADDVAWCEFLRDASVGKIPPTLRAHRKTLSESLRTARDSESSVPAIELESRVAVSNQTHR